MLEIFETPTYLLFVISVIIGIGLITRNKKKSSFFGEIMPALIVGVFFSLFLVTVIYINESKCVSDKIHSIPKKDLVEFFKSKDLSLFPKENRYAWIGVLHRKIDIVPRNRVSAINAVGWNHNNLFAYYDLDKDEYSNSHTGF